MVLIRTNLIFISLSDPWKPQGLIFASPLQETLYGMNFHLFFSFRTQPGLSGQVGVDDRFFLSNPILILWVLTHKCAANTSRRLEQYFRAYQQIARTVFAQFQTLIEQQFTSDGSIVRSLTAQSGYRPIEQLSFTHFEQPVPQLVRPERSWRNRQSTDRNLAMYRSRPLISRICRGRHGQRLVRFALPIGIAQQGSTRSSNRARKPTNRERIMNEILFSVLISDALSQRIEMPKTLAAESFGLDSFIFISDSLAVAGSQNYCRVPKSDILEQGYDLSINRYKEVVHEEVEHRAPQAMLDELDSIEKEITQGMKQLRGMLK